MGGVTARPSVRRHGLVVLRSGRWSLRSGHSITTAAFPGSSRQWRQRRDETTGGARRFLLSVSGRFRETCPPRALQATLAAMRGRGLDLVPISASGALNAFSPAFRTSPMEPVRSRKDSGPFERRARVTTSLMTEPGPRVQALVRQVLLHLRPAESNTVGSLFGRPDSATSGPNLAERRRCTFSLRFARVDSDRQGPYERRYP